MGLVYNLSVTGHRPNKISSDLYNVNSDLSKKYIAYFKQYIYNLAIEYPSKTIHCISGMALGMDTFFAIATILLKEQGLSVELECAIPCANHSSRWQNESVRVYNKILESADKITYVSDKPYTRNCMQDRNIYMVKNSNKVLAIWDGTNGGTGNCVRYAQSVNKLIDIVRPIYK